MGLNLVMVFVLLCGVMTVGIAVYAWQRRTTSGARQFALFMAAMSIYILGYSLELASIGITSMLFWNKIQYIGILTFPTLFLIFAIQYTGHGTWLTRRKTALLFIIPLVFLVTKFLDGSLHLIYAGATVDTSGGIPLLSFSRGPLYLVVTAYNLVTILVGYYLLIQKWRFASALYRQQTGTMLAAAGIILPVYIYYVSGITLFPALKHLDPNPFIYTLWGLAIGISIFRYRLFELAPIARDALIEMLCDGVVLLDPQSRVVDANPEAMRIFDWPELPAGEFAGRLMNGWVDRDFLSEVHRPAKIETHILKNNAVHYYEVTISNLQEKGGRVMGYLVLVHDISARKYIENELHELSLADELTGLTNRRGFKMLASQLLAMANRMELHATLFYFDLDNLKWINDKLGHATGDAALKETAGILKRTFRSSDIIARLGGDEFVVLKIASLDSPPAAALDRLQEHLDALALENPQFKVSLSVGLACYDWRYPQTLETLLEEADRDMYEKKNAKKVRLNAPVYF